MATTLTISIIILLLTLGDLKERPFSQLLALRRKDLARQSQAKQRALFDCRDAECAETGVFLDQELFAPSLRD